MKFRATGKVLGVLLMFYSLTLLSPVIVDYIYQENNARAFILGFVITFSVGLLLWVLTHKNKKELTPRDGFIVVFLIWFVLGLFGAIPYMLSKGLHLSISDAVFESMSGITTTGATLITHLDDLPKSILYYRQQAQFFGGMGIIVLAVAILPLIGVGGMQLYRAEASGPWKENKLTPRIMETAKALWLIYIVLAIACIISYYVAGMSLFDAICYAFSTVGTGGFAPHDVSMAYYSDKPQIYLIAMVFMLIGAVSFALHFVALSRRRISIYWKDTEFRFYIYYLFFIGLVVGLTLILQQYYSNSARALLESFFQVLSFATNTGFTSNSDYASWPLFIPTVLMLLGLVGGCAGSTSGGIKIIRAVLVKQQLSREMSRLVHPQGVFPIKFGTKAMSEGAINSVWAFIAGYFCIMTFLWLVLMLLSVEPMTALAAIAACISNTGAGISEISANYSALPDLANWVLALAMLVGRLEVFTVLVLLMPAFWRR
ncbi:TrkH family potassium uptake protein [Thiotrichales bacterium 19S11-10]|nr:TrkH family potassium uptake protein [Thiotrichales bacterium 19S11-10]MCF6806846.1 TrkH family potassium uptake protein [Thiotrichales bacterium 19S9-11]MCF6810815.1 TrkH family potassium uptake protein [Thiotrichales bacterium 19S9-12]